MSEEETIYERRLNGLLFDAANKTDEFVRHKIAIIEAGNALQDSYLAALQQCCRKHDEVLKLEEYVLTQISTGAALVAGSGVLSSQARISPSHDALERVADQFVDPPFSFSKENCLAPPQARACRLNRTTSHLRTRGRRSRFSKLVRSRTRGASYGRINASRVQQQVCNLVT